MGEPRKITLLALHDRDAISRPCPADIGSVAALPAEPMLEARAVNCAKVTGALFVLKNLGPPASTFCSSFLKVPATTTIITSTTSTR